MICHGCRLGKSYRKPNIYNILLISPPHRFMIGAVAVVLIVGKLYTLYNAKWLYIIFTVIFMAASALCGAAPTINAEIVGRVFVGVGGNGMYIGVLTLLSLNTTSRERPQYLSLTYVYGVGTYEQALAN